MNGSAILGLIWLAAFVVLVGLIMATRRGKRRMGTMTGAVGATWDLQTDQKRKALEIIVENRAEARDPERAEGDLPDLETPEGADDFSRLEYRGWQRVASKYEQTWSGLTGNFVSPLLDAAGVTRGTRVLDVACGPGYVSEAAAARGAATIGVDFSPEMIRVAKARRPDLEFRRGDAQSLDFPDASFDAVVMNFGVLHVASPGRAFAEAARVLRAGGRYAFTTWAGPEESPGARILRTAIDAHANLDVALPEGPDHYGQGGTDEWRRTLADFPFDPASVAVTRVQAEWQVPTASFLFESERHAGVRTAALLAAQTPQALEAIRTDMEAGVRAFAKDGGYAIPYTAYVVSASLR